MARVLVIDDDRALLKAFRVGLVARGHEVVTAVTGEEGLARAATGAPELVVIDLGLPDIDGIEVCARLRAWSDVPIIVLSATGAEERKVAALDRGADDYVTKPFGMAELEARIRAAIRARAGGEEVEPELSVGPLELDLLHHQARLDGDPLALTAKEFDLLAFLARHAGRICTHQMILRAVWGSGYGEESEYLRVYVYRLRRKLGPHADLLRSVPGIGYQLGAA